MLTEDVASSPPCVSLVFQGRLLRQSATDIPDLDPDMIVVRWPWRLKLRVDRVVYGQHDSRRLEATGIQHTGIRPDYPRTFFLGEINGEYRLMGFSPDHLFDHGSLVSLAESIGSDLCPQP